MLATSAAPRGHIGGTALKSLDRAPSGAPHKGNYVNNIIYIIGLIVVILAILSFLGLR